MDWDDMCNETIPVKLLSIIHNWKLSTYFIRAFLTIEKNGSEMRWMHMERCDLILQWDAQVGLFLFTHLCQFGKKHQTATNFSIVLECSMALVNMKLTSLTLNAKNPTRRQKTETRIDQLFSLKWCANRNNIFEGYGSCLNVLERPIHLSSHEPTCLNTVLWYTRMAKICSRTTQNGFGIWQIKLKCAEAKNW